MLQTQKVSYEYLCFSDTVLLFLDTFVDTFFEHFKLLIISRRSSFVSQRKNKTNCELLPEQRIRLFTL